MVFTKVLDGARVNLSGRKFVHPDLFDKALPVMQDILMGNTMRSVVPANISPCPLMQNHENDCKGDQSSAICRPGHKNTRGIVQPDFKIFLRHKESVGGTAETLKS